MGFWYCTGATIKEKKSDDYYVELLTGLTHKQLMTAVERADFGARLYTSSIGELNRYGISKMPPRKKIVVKRSY